MITPLLAHNFYQQPGGEDQVFAAEKRLLEANGHRVLSFTAHNDEVAGLSKLRMARLALWNPGMYRRLRTMLRQEKPDVIHFHNTLPLISPAAYYAAKDENIPVVQTLHNYRLVCPNALLFREGSVCESCLGKYLAWPGVMHGCYRGSRSASAVVAGMVAYHRLLQTWVQKVDLYIALTEFARQKLIEGGLPAEKIAVKPNFLPVDPGFENTSGTYALFVGRLSPEKGIVTLLDAWCQPRPPLPLKIVGDGPLAAYVRNRIEGNNEVEWLGNQPHEHVIELMRRAFVLILPSLWYEGFPMTVVEAFAVGLPIIASNLGSMSSLIEHGKTGLHIRPGDASDLRAHVEWAVSNPEGVKAMRRSARATFLAHFSGEQNYRHLLQIYGLAIDASRRKGAPN